MIRSKKTRVDRGWKLAGFFVAQYNPKYVYVHKAHVMALHPSMDVRNNAEFYAVAEPVVESGRTMLQYYRLFHLWQAVESTRHLRHAIAEIGTYKGGSAYFLAGAAKALVGEELPVYVFDTFEGHPENVDRELEPLQKPQTFNDTSYEDVKNYLSDFALTKVYKGEVSESLKTLPEETYSVVHIDVDIYQGTLDCLKYFGPRLASGGVMVVDDYGVRSCPGVDKAVKEFLVNNPDFYSWDLRTEQLILLKR